MKALVVANKRVQRWVEQIHQVFAAGLTTDWQSLHGAIYFEDDTKWRGMGNEYSKPVGRANGSRSRSISGRTTERSNPSDTPSCWFHFIAVLLLSAAALARIRVERLEKGRGQLPQSLLIPS